MSGLARKVVLFNASPRTSNLGVSALCRASVEGICRRSDGIEIEVMAAGPQADYHSSVLPKGRARICSFSPLTRRIWSRHCGLQWKLARKTGLPLSSVARRVEQAHAVLDISGGDSFTDLYEERVWHGIQLPKKMAIAQGKPLILLPQTIGPFEAEGVRREAAEIVGGAAAVFSRDRVGMDTLASLVKEGGYQTKCVEGVDVAFALRAEEPTGRALEIFSKARRDAEVLVGINVSGLVWFSELRASQRGDDHGVFIDYKRLLSGFIKEVLRIPRSQVILVPHVLAEKGSFESDPAASEELLRLLPESDRNRVHCIPPEFGECQAKWMISRCDWFCGARMHATIAGLSAGVPTINLAYSMKSSGVFASVGRGEAVLDLREGDEPEMLERLVASVRNLREDREAARESSEEAKRRGEEVMDQVVDSINALPG